MKNKNLKYILVAIFVSFLFLTFSNVNAKVYINEQTSALAGSAGFSNGVSVESIVATVILAFLGLLGIIFVGLMVYAGYNWMTASGDSDKIETAKNTIRRAIIGLIIIVSAYAITYFVFSKLPATGGQQTTVE